MFVFLGRLYKYLSWMWEINVNEKNVTITSRNDGQNYKNKSQSVINKKLPFKLEPKCLFAAILSREALVIVLVLHDHDCPKVKSPLAITTIPKVISKTH